MAIPMVMHGVRRRLDHVRWQLALGARRLRFGGRNAHRVPLRWIRRVELVAEDRICLFVLLPVGGTVLPHSSDHIAAWRGAGYKVVAIAAVASLDEAIDLSSLGEVDGFAMRLNKGYDFGAWAAMIRDLRPTLGDAATLALANDSVLGPSDRFAAMLARVDQSEADVIGLIESSQIRRHFQSFVMFFKPRALAAPAFALFWDAVRSGGRQYVIDRYETMLLARFAAAGLRCETLFTLDGDDGGNPTLGRWRDLLDTGFPYIKVQLFRDNPWRVSLHDWREAAADGGIDVTRLDRQIAALKRHGRAQWQI